MDKVDGLYGSRMNKNKAVGFCPHHGKCLSVKQLKAHECLKKNCWYLVKYEDHEWWHQRELAKQRKKEKKQMLKEKLGI